MNHNKKVIKRAPFQLVYPEDTSWYHEHYMLKEIFEQPLSVKYYSVVY